jgi:hypothetical protein
VTFGALQVMMRDVIGGKGFCRRKRLAKIGAETVKKYGFKLVLASTTNRGAGTFERLRSCRGI